MRRSQLVLGGIVVLVALLVAWKLRGGGDDPATRSGGDGDPAAETTGGEGARGATAGKAALATASLGGRVTRAADGSPVAGAMVAVSRDALMPMLGRRGDERSTLVTTDANGAWKVPNLFAGSYSVGVTAAGLVPGSKLHVAVAPGKHTAVDFALAAGGVAVTGTVTDIGGGPIGGARVTVVTSSGLPIGGRAELVAVTGADGKYQLQLGDGGHFASASHDDYTRATKSFELHGLPISVDFVLAPGGAIRGVVVTRDGKPVPGARVSAETERTMRDGGATGHGDDSGAFALTSLPSGAIRLTATAKGYASSSPTVVELGIGEQVEGVRIVVDRAYSIRGRVVRAGHPDQPLAGVTVGYFSMTGGGAGAGEDPSADDGSFEIHGIRPASYLLFAIGEGSVPDIGKSIEVVDKDVTGVIIELATGATLSGKVEPGMVASLGLEVDDDNLGFGKMFDAMKAMIVRGESDATGAFTLRAAPPGDYKLVATTTDGRKGSLDITVGTADQTDLIVKLDVRGSIAGKVVDEKGAAVAGVRIVVTALDQERGRGGMRFRGGFGADRGAVTALDGSFKVVGLDDGKLGLAVEDEYGTIPFKAEPSKSAGGPTRSSAEGDAKWIEKPLAFELTKAQALTGVTLTVEARDGVIRGVVIGTDKVPVPDAFVSASPEVKPGSNPREWARFLRSPDPILTGADGTFTITRLRRGTYQLTVEGPKGASRAAKSGVKTGDSVTLVLEPLGSITGKVTLAGAPVGEFDLGCRPEGPGMRFSSDLANRRFSNPDGSYQVERLAPGEYACSANASAGVATGKVVVATGPSTLDLVLQPYASITGTVVDTVTGKPVPDLLVFATGDGTDGKQFMDIMSGKGPTTDANGRFVVERIPAGKGQVHVAPKDATFNHLATRDYTATAGQRIELGTIKLVPPRDGPSGTYGFFPMVKDAALVVGDVKDDTPAAAAGLVEGDQIVAIDGRPVAELGADVGKQLLMPGAVPVGTRVALTLERAGQAVPVSLIAIEF